MTSIASVLNILTKDLVRFTARVTVDQLWEWGAAAMKGTAVSHSLPFFSTKHTSNEINYVEMRVIKWNVFQKKPPSAKGAAAKGHMSAANTLADLVERTKTEATRTLLVILLAPVSYSPLPSVSNL